MKSGKLSCLIILSAAAVFLAGCADIRQEITVSPKGQIDCSQQISIDDPTAALAEQEPLIAALLGDLQPIDLDLGGVRYQGAVQDGQWIYRAEVSPADISACPGMPGSSENALILIPADGPRTRFIGRLAFTITDMKGWVSSALESFAGKLVADQLAARFEDSMLAGHHWTIIFHAPGRVVATNGKLDSLTNTVTWQYGLSDFVGAESAPRILEAVYLPAGYQPTLWETLEDVPAAYLILGGLVIGAGIILILWGVTFLVRVLIRKTGKAVH
jgi:hypothetical protein